MRRKSQQIMEESRSGRTHHVGQACQRERDGAGELLKNEYPQTVSVVLSKIKPEHAARVLASLPEEFALEVVQRMLRMESVQKDILDKVERTLRVEFMSNLARTAKRDAHEHMAESSTISTARRKPIRHRAGRAQPRLGRTHQALISPSRIWASSILGPSRRCCAM